jgi:hypothetical protein
MGSFIEGDVKWSNNGDHLKSSVVVKAVLEVAKETAELCHGCSDGVSNTTTTSQGDRHTQWPCYVLKGGRQVVWRDSRDEVKIYSSRLLRARAKAIIRRHDMPASKSSDAVLKV